MSAASSAITEKYLLFLISCDRSFKMWAPTVSIISFWMVFEMYVAFLGAVSRCCCSVWSPLSTRNSSNAWKLPVRAALVGSSSLRPLSGMLFFPQKIIVLKRDFRISRFLAICCWTMLFNCWSIGTAPLCIILLKSFIAVIEKLWISQFPSECLVKREAAEVQFVRGDFNNLSNLLAFRPHWTPKQTQAKQNAPSKYLE